MRKIIPVLAFLLASLTSIGARADSIFDLNGTLQDGTGVFTGTITYSSFSKEFGHVTGTVKDANYSFTVPNSYLGETLDFGTLTLVDVFAVNSNFDLSLYFMPDVLLKNGGGALCALSTPCQLSPNPQRIASSFDQSENNGSFPFTQFQTLTATQQVTPEPGTFLLLATGMLGFVGAAKRRLIKHS